MPLSLKYSNVTLGTGRSLVHGTVQTTAMFPTLNESVQPPAPRKSFRLVVAYDGTGYFGWQVQPGLPTVQGRLADAIHQLTGEDVLPQGSGRTDTGVHAVGQVVSVELAAAIPTERLCGALNRKLPPDIRVLSASDAPPGFHARAGVLHKTYEYRIFERYPADGTAERVCLPAQARYAWDCRWPLRLEPMQQAAAELIGRHDFTSFAASDPDRSQRLLAAGEPVDNTRTIFRSAWLREDGLLKYRVTGSGFLHHMVRNIVGTCVDVGAGRVSAEAVPALLAARDRRQAGATAPPQGLHLVRVVYAGDEAPATPARTIEWASA